MNRLMVSLLFLFILVMFYAVPAEAAKKRVFKSGSKGKAVAGSFSTARLSRATNSVVITFLNLKKVKKVTYTLSYTANGIAQGVVGSLVPTGLATDSRDLYFGTCSAGVCTPHGNITGATLTVSTQLTSGSNVKRYRIKV